MQAIIHTIEPFSAALGTEIGYTWNGNQIYKARLIVKNNETGVTVYDQTIETMKTTYTVPADSGLVNGTYYVAYITVFDADNNESELQSVGTPFYCFSVPVFGLNIENNNIIKSSSYGLTINYSQTEDEKLDSWDISLYSFTRTLLQTSGTSYGTSDMAFIIDRLENHTQYYIRATGTTLHGMPLDTGYLLVSVIYDTPQIFVNLEAINNSLLGSINVQTYIVSVEGKSVKEVSYIDGTKIDIRDNSVLFDSGFQISGDFQMLLIAGDFIVNKEIAVIKDIEHNSEISLTYRIGNYKASGGVACFIELREIFMNETYVVYSKFLPVPDDEQQIVIRTERIGGYYNLYAELL